MEATSTAALVTYLGLDINSWIVLQSIGTIAAVLVAIFAIRQSNKHLKVEQTPYAVVEHVEKKASSVEITVKNVGKGPALHVTCSKSDDSKNRNEPFFRDTQPHSVNLASGEKQSEWIVDRNVFDDLNSDSENYKHLFVFYEGQLGILYRTDVKIKDIEEERGSKCYVVMENKIEEIKIGVDCD